MSATHTHTHTHTRTHTHTNTQTLVYEITDAHFLELKDEKFVWLYLRLIRAGHVISTSSTICGKTQNPLRQPSKINPFHKFPQTLPVLQVTKSFKLQIIPFLPLFPSLSVTGKMQRKWIAHRENGLGIKT